MSYRSPAGDGGPRFGAYRHRQIGAVILGSLSVAMLILIGSVVAEPDRLVGLVLLPLFVVIGSLFGWQTVSVDDSQLQCRLGVGLIRKRIPLVQIDAVVEARFPWYWGWGLRFTPRGLLYRVSGLGGIEVDLLNGKRYLIGTDEPRELARAIRQRLGRNE
jgi:hypothetical protein